VDSGKIKGDYLNFKSISKKVKSYLIKGKGITSFQKIVSNVRHVVHKKSDFLLVSGENNLLDIFNLKLFKEDDYTSKDYSKIFCIF
jgi:hypothetical protein